MINIEELDFHDAVILDVQQIGHDILFKLESVQYCGKNIAGCLKIGKILTIEEEGSIVSSICKHYDDGEIWQLDIEDGKMELIINWTEYKNDLSLTKSYEIQHTTISWIEFQEAESGTRVEEMRLK